tara:strand:- start:4750 stop:5499 length:750 start_codon:yes stop_codon:yes gene_type:complete
MIEIIPNWHPFVIHFSVALLCFSTALFLLGYIPALNKKRDELLVTAKWSLYIGTCFTVLAVASGWQAYSSVNHDTAGHAAMTIHKTWALLTLMLYLLTACLFYFTQRKGIKIWFIFLLLISTGSLMVTGYLGSENVYRHGLGVMRIPAIHAAGDANAGPHGHHGTMAKLGSSVEHHGESSEMPEADSHEGHHGSMDKIDADLDTFIESLELPEAHSNEGHHDSMDEAEVDSLGESPEMPEAHSHEGHHH